MKTEIRTVMLPKEKAFWVADDGTTFESESDCVDYELEACRKQLADSKDVIECKEALDHSPFDGGEYPESHNYRWFKPLNENGVELLNKAFPSSYAKLGDDSIDNWHCVEYTVYDNECWWYELSGSQRYADKLLELLEPERYNRSGYVTELCSNCDTEVEMRWDVEMFGYKAYCPYCGQRLMLCDECQHPNGEYDDNCDYCTETDSCRFNKKSDKEGTR